LKTQSLEGSAQIDLSILQPGRTVLLDAVDHDVSGIWQVPGQGEPVELEFENTGRQLQSDMGRPFQQGEKFRLRINYAVTQPQSGLHFFKPSEAEPDVPWMAWTQGEPRHNHYWFP